ncbi:MAG: hypothetical protein U5S82_18560 [Gammaproteobacteria bacterium]|nr:hypothetical protein [Gammaproteobacteria bacterium]
MRRVDVLHQLGRLLQQIDSRHRPPLAMHVLGDTDIALRTVVGIRDAVGDFDAAFETMALAEIACQLAQHIVARLPGGDLQGGCNAQLEVPRRGIAPALLRLLAAEHGEKARLLQR